MSSTKITAELLAELLEKQSESLLKAVAKLIQEHSAAAAAAPTNKAKKSKKTAAAPSDDDSAPKPKREPNEWIKFAQRVERLVRAAETAAETAKEQKMRTVVVKQFASSLKSQKPYAEWSDDEITEALNGWEAPAESKQAKRKDSAGSSAASAADAEKPKRKWSAEAKASAAAKRAEKKAAKTAEAVAESDDEEPAEKPVRKLSTASIKAKPKPKDNAAELLFKKWTHKGTEYWRNARGDVVSAEMDWVGHWDGKKINEKAEQPEDLAEAKFEEDDE